MNMTPHELDAYRKTTDRVSRFAVTKTQRCPYCRAVRSFTQFDPGKAACKKCRGK